MRKMTFTMGMLAVLAAGASHADTPATQATMYQARVQVMSAGELVADLNANVADHVPLDLKGTDAKGRTYEVKLTPFFISDTQVGVAVDSKVTTPLPGHTFTTAGQTLNAPSSAECASVNSAKLDLGTETTVHSNPGFHPLDGGEPLPGCAVRLTIVKQ